MKPLGIWVGGVTIFFKLISYSTKSNTEDLKSKRIVQTPFDIRVSMCVTSLSIGLSPDKARIFTFQSHKYFKDLSSGKYSFMLT